MFLKLEFVIVNIYVNFCVIVYKNYSISISVFMNVSKIRIVHKLVYKNHWVIINMCNN